MLNRTTRPWQRVTGLFNDTWTVLEGSQIELTTSGGPLLIFMDVTLVGQQGGWVTCRPNIGGKWPGIVSEIPDTRNFGEGVISLISRGYFTMWSKSRLYLNVVKGDYDAWVECMALGTPSASAPTPVASACDTPATCDWGIIELNH